MPDNRALANAVRALSMDAVQKAKSGHPGAPMGMADIAEVLWNNFLIHNPCNPSWGNRDRFVLSNGHGSMLIYSLLHLSGYDISIDDIKNFRQLHSKTAGHPELHEAPGVETTTGPLGQGLANAVGMALAEKQLATEFNRDGFSVVDHTTYVFAGDGCLMEGISHEACSLAGTLELGKLVLFWDDNGISIDGEVEGWFSDDTAMRFKAYGWQVISDVDGHDAEAIHRAVAEAKMNTAQPTLICCRTVIGYGSPNKQGTASCHGAPLGDDEIKLAKEQLGWTEAPFEVPDDIRAGWDARDAGAKSNNQWNELFEEYSQAHPKLAAEYTRRMAGELPSDWDSIVADKLYSIVPEKGAALATRKASQQCLEALGADLPEFLGGSADLTGSNLTAWSGSVTLTGTTPGNYISYGVREFAMGAMMNGLALHGGLLPYGGTFLVFSDYMRSAIRMAAMMQLRSVYVLTHDSIGLGEDGPTHQPVEHIASLRLIPGVDVWRPADVRETAVAWQMSVERQDGPSLLCLSRQSMPEQDVALDTVEQVKRGGYVLFDCPSPQLILIATGSEVGLAVDAAQKLTANDVAVRVVSMPSTNVFDRQDAAYRESVLPKAVKRRIAIEPGVTDAWYKYVGFDGAVIGLDRFGASAPAEELYNYFGITVDAIVEKADTLLAAE